MMGFGRALGAALLGTAIGWLMVLAVTAAMGVVVMFVAWPIYTVLLAVLGLVAALLVAVVARQARLGSARVVMAVSAVLTCAPFMAVVLVIMSENAASGRW